MSVIIGRALPDVRDGLKPAHRRVLFGMKAMGLSSNARLPQVRQDRRRGDGQLPPARRRVDLRHAGAHGAGLQHALRRWSTARATSARSTATRRRRCATPRRASSRSADEMMADLDKDTVDFVPNYDETTEEPTVLPAPFPNLLVNGSVGHRRRHGHQHPAAQPARGDRRRDLDDRSGAIATQPPTAAEKQRKLLEIVPGPDFPTGGYIVGRAGHPAGLPHRPRLRHHARQGRDRGHEEGRSPVDRHQRHPLPGEQGPPDRAHRRAGARKDDRGHLGHPRRIRSRRHAHRRSS